MIEVNFEIDDRAVRKLLSDLEQSQVPFATSLAMNNTMKIAQEDVRAEFMRVFVARNKALPKAITTIPRGSFATKRKLRVEMMNVQDRRTGRMAGAGFINRQIRNQTKVAKNNFIAIPVLGKGMKRLQSGGIPKAKKPRNRTDLIRKGNALFQPMRGRKLRLRYILTKTARPSKAGPFNYYKVGKQSIKQHLRREWIKAMARAVSTAKQKIPRAR